MKLSLSLVICASYCIATSTTTTTTTTEDITTLTTTTDNIMDKVRELKRFLYIAFLFECKIGPKLHCETLS